MKTKDLKIEYIKSNGDIALEDALENSKRDIATGYIMLDHIEMIGS